MCEDIKEMHEMADILLNPPSFGSDIYLYNPQYQPTRREAD
jgi:hypothetical protein